MWRVYTDYTDRFSPYIRIAQSKPGWVTRLTITAMVLTVAIPLLALVLLAIFVGVVVFFVLSLIATIMGVFGGGFAGERRDDNAGRENVRVRIVDQE